MKLPSIVRAIALATLFAVQASAQPPQPDNVALLVNRTTGRIVGPVPAATFATANTLSGAGPTSGTVTSFSAGNLAGLFTTSEATPDTTPALSFTLIPAAANMVWAGPGSGASAAPSYRLLVANDIPTLPLSKLATDPLARGNHTGAQAIGTVTGLQAALDAKAGGGTTVGTSLLNLANPSAITFLRLNADNSATALSAAGFKTSLGLAAVATSGSAADLSGNLAGNAATATALQTARTINGVLFDGTANVTLPAAAAGTLTGTTLAAGVTGSSLTAAAGGTFGSAAYMPASAFAPAGTTGSGGTVTTFSIVPANGVSGTVANATTTPAATFVLGAIVPTSVNGVVLSGSGTPTLAVTGSAAVSGTNTGDQTSVSGNAGSATVLQTPRAINGVNFDGSAPITIAAAAGTLTGSTLAAGVTGSSLLSAAGGTFGTAAFTASGNYTAANASISGATKTKITYDAKGLVLAGADATTSDFADTLNKRFVSDAQLAILGNTSGTNTGDQTSVSGNAGSATVLQTARAINGVSFDGSAPITVAAAAGTLTGTTLAAGVTGSSLLSAAGGSFGSAAFTASGNYTAANVAITGATKTKITYDAKGLVTAGADATTADFADTLNKRFVSDAQLAILGNTSGTNTGDQTSVSGNAGSATVLQTARAINGVSFNGSAPITITAAGSTLTGTSLAAGIATSSLTTAAGGTFGTAAFQPSTAFLAAAGNAASATVLQTPRAINGVNFDGSAPITVAAAAGTLTGTTLAAGVTGSSLLSAAGGSFGTAAFQPSTAFLSAAGNAASASILATARTINGVSFNGSANINIPAGTTGTDLTLTGFLTAGTKVTTPQIDLGALALSNSYEKLMLYNSGTNKYGIGVISDGSMRAFVSDGGVGFKWGTMAASDGTTWTEKASLSSVGNFAAIGAGSFGSTLSANTYMLLNGPTATPRWLYWTTAGVGRWGMRAAENAETGSNAGSDFELWAFNDAGGPNMAVFSVKRDTAEMVFGYGTKSLRWDLTHVGLTYAATTNIDMAGSGLMSVQVTGNVTFTTSNKVAGRTKKVMIWADASSRTLTFPAGWHFLGPKPTSIAAGKWSELTLTCYSTSEIDITAVYLVEL